MGLFPFSVCSASPVAFERCEVETVRLVDAEASLLDCSSPELTAFALVEDNEVAV